MPTALDAAISTPLDRDGLAAATRGVVRCPLDPLAVLAISGADATPFLHGQFSTDIRVLSPATCQYTSFNSAAGRMLANLILWHATEDPANGFLALLPADLGEPFRKRLGMYVLRSKATITDASAAWVRIGVGGPGAAAAIATAFGSVPKAFGVLRHGTTAVLALPGARFIVVAPVAESAAIDGALAPVAQAAPFAAWQWLTVRAGVPVITAAVQDRFVAQTLNWEVLGGVNFHKGCYTGQEIIARMHYLGRLKERLFIFHAPTEAAMAGDRLWSSAFGEQPCGTVVNAAPAPEGGCDLVAVVQLAAAASGDVRLGAPDGPALAALPMPYELPPPTEPRGRLAARPAKLS